MKDQAKSFTNKSKPLISNKKRPSKEAFIPKEVANRMARRVVITSGVPTLCGMGVFVGSYFLITKGITDVAPSLTLTISAFCFLLGLLGLSFGILSASWEDSRGSFLGLENISPNIKRMKNAFRASDSKTK